MPAVNVRSFHPLVTDRLADRWTGYTQHTTAALPFESGRLALYVGHDVQRCGRLAPRMGQDVCIAPCQHKRKNNTGK